MAEASPVIPSEVESIVSDPTASLCGNFKNTLLRFPALFYEWFKWAFDASGFVTPALLRQIHAPGDLIFSAAPLAETASRKLCNGQELIRADFPDLFTAIGTSYGTPSSGTVFKLPDYRNKFPRGVGNSPVAGTGGADEVTLTIQNIPPHNHPNPDNQDTVAVDKASSAGGIGLDFSGGGVHKDTSWTGMAGGSGSPAAAQPFDIVPPFVSVYIYIST
jgi:microcystin-dependent protein